MSLGHSVMNTDQIAGDEGRSEEAWVIGANPELAIRARNVSMYLERGGSLKEVRLTESEHGDWSVWLRLAAPGCAWLRLAGRTGEYRLAKFKSDAPKLYRDVSLAVAACRDDFGYFGPIILSTDRHTADPPAQNLGVA
jgi:hypothetical protein